MLFGVHYHNKAKQVKNPRLIMCIPLLCWGFEAETKKQTFRTLSSHWKTLDKTQTERNQNCEEKWENHKRKPKCLWKIKAMNSLNLGTISKLLLSILKPLSKTLLILQFIGNSIFGCLCLIYSSLLFDSEFWGKKLPSWRCYTCILFDWYESFLFVIHVVKPECGWNEMSLVQSFGEELYLFHFGCKESHVRKLQEWKFWFCICLALPIQGKLGPEGSNWELF